MEESKKKLKEYKAALNDHIDNVKDVLGDGFPLNGVITITYDIDSASFVASMDNGISTRGSTSGGSGNPFP